MDRGNRRLQYLIACALSSSAITNGVSFSWATPVVPKFIKNEAGFQMSDAEISWVIAISSLGFMTGSLVARFTSDRFGRRITILGSALPVTVGAVFVIFAWKAWLLCVVRFLWGVGLGMLASVSMMYLGEIADTDIRGKMTTCNRSMLRLGGLLVTTVGSIVSYNTLNYIMLVLPMSYFAACWWIPETPYYHLKEGRVEAARLTLMKLKGVKDASVIEEKLLQMKSDVRREMNRTSSFKELLTGKLYRRAVIIVIGIKMAQINTGLHALQNYLGSIIQESNSGIEIPTAIIIFGSVRFISGLMSSMLIDRVGRRPLMIYSFFGSGVFLASVGAYFSIHFDPDKGNNPYGIIPFVSIILTTIISIIGYESVTYIIPAELFPINVKAIAMSSINIYGGVLNFLSAKSYQQLKDLIGLKGVFFFYATSAFTGAVFSYFFVPETKNKSFREIQIELQGNFYEEENEKLNQVVANGENVDNHLNHSDVVNERLNGIAMNGTSVEYRNQKNEETNRLTARRENVENHHNQCDVVNENLNGIAMNGTSIENYHHSVIQKNEETNRLTTSRENVEFHSDIVNKIKS